VPRLASPRTAPAYRRRLAHRCWRPPKQIQELAGHRSITTTMDFYGHLFEGLQGELADRLGERSRVLV
jgi:integrase